MKRPTCPLIVGGLVLSAFLSLPSSARETGDKTAAAVATLDDSSWRNGPSEAWFVNWDKALAEARKTRKAIFVLNTGSDWCYWCKRLHQDVLDQPAFASFARKNLVLLYLDNPGRNPLEKDQKNHNRQIVKALQFGGGVPSVVLVSHKGKRLGTIGGGGQSLEDYLHRVENALASDARDFDSPEADILFKQGYAVLAAKIAAERAALPPVGKEDFKARVTGVAVTDKNGFKNPDSIPFKETATPCSIPYGNLALIRVEYDLPKGYEAQIWSRANFPREEREKGRSLASAPSGLLKGKGVTYGYLTLTAKGVACEVKEIRLRIKPEPELDDFPNGWSPEPIPVALSFAARKDAEDVTDSAADEPSAAPQAPADDRKWRKGPDRLWHVNWDKAVAEAKKTKKKIFVLNTGSDWCGWCKKLKADVLTSSKFKALARKKLILFYLDNPRRNPLPEVQQTYNRELARFLSFGGGVPCAKIVDPDDNSVLDTISGYQPEKEYLQRLASVLESPRDARK